MRESELVNGGVGSYQCTHLWSDLSRSQDRQSLFSSPDLEPMEALLRAASEAVLKRLAVKTLPK